MKTACLWGWRHRFTDLAAFIILSRCLIRKLVGPSTKEKPVVSLNHIARTISPSFMHALILCPDPSFLVRANVRPSPPSRKALSIPPHLLRKLLS